MGVVLAGREPYLGAAAVLIRESGCTIRCWRSGNNGVAYTREADWGIEVPQPRGPVSFGVLAHEVAHQLRHRAAGGRRLQRWHEELEAEAFALEQFDRFGLPGRDQYERHAYRHVLRAYEKAARRAADVDALEDRFLDVAPGWLWRRLLDHAAFGERAAGRRG